MAIVITRTAAGYTASVTPPHAATWSSDRHYTAAELAATLRGLGCHQTDVGDAFYIANPKWLDDVDSQI
jgi:hypothetical protein